MTVQCVFFDGKTSRQHQVNVAIQEHLLVIEGNTVQRRYALADLDLGESLDDGPLILRFNDGASCEEIHGRALESMIEQAGRSLSTTTRLQRHKAWGIASLALLIGLVIAGYRWGLPWTAEQLAPHLPHTAVAKLGELVLRSLDREVLKTSKLSAARQENLRTAVATLATKERLPEYRLMFRASSLMGANAFALPGGTVVVLDNLATLATDDQLLATIAHELGHVKMHHPVRRLIQDAVVTTAVAAYLGDLSTAVASATALALNANYSRDFELSADRYAAERLFDAGKDPRNLISLLEKIDRPHAAPSVIGSHPDLAVRAEAIERFITERSAETKTSEGKP